ncbi:hypothetical protein [Sphingomonas sp. PB2P19]|uniref:hypothetical protein n=1 Tax=Sphingomonas rhamnosi TaxID=3096156 RepID=UPI002FCB0890
MIEAQDSDDAHTSPNVTPIPAWSHACGFAEDDDVMPMTCPADEGELAERDQKIAAAPSGFWPRSIYHSYNTKPSSRHSGTVSARMNVWPKSGSDRPALDVCLWVFGD